MELSEATLELLQDEAYAFLCRRVVEDKLASLEHEKAEIASTRPPFGILARKETRDAFARSMRTALDNEAALRDRLTQIRGIEEWLRPRLRQDVAAYLAEVSPDYRRFQQVRARLEEWARTLQALPEFLVAFARELRNLRQSGGPDLAAGRRVVSELPGVREAAVRLEQQQHELLAITATVAELTQGGAMSEIRPPALPDFQRIAWVSRLAVLPPDQALSEATRVEKEIRDFLGDGLDLVHARFEISCDMCAQLENKALEQYWDQLRAHARAHYVEERDVDDVLAMLAQRYVSDDLARRQKELSLNPFVAER